MLPSVLSCSLISFSSASFQSPPLFKSDIADEAKWHQGEKWVASFALKVNGGEKELNSETVLKGMLAWVLCLYMHIDTGEKQETKKIDKLM